MEARTSQQSLTTALSIEQQEGEPVWLIGKPLKETGYVAGTVASSIATSVIFGSAGTVG